MIPSFWLLLLCLAHCSTQNWLITTRQCLKYYVESPNVTNLASTHAPFSNLLENVMKEEKERKERKEKEGSSHHYKNHDLSLHLKLLSKLRWATLGYHYGTFCFLPSFSLSLSLSLLLIHSCSFLFFLLPFSSFFLFFLRHRHRRHSFIVNHI
jgi:hypothetical protein